MNDTVDLHTHTTCSDGFLKPKELLLRAKEYGLRAISITDHDTIAGYTEDTINYAEELDIELVPGIEFSTKDAGGNKYHILGLYIDSKNQDFIALTEKLKERRFKTTKEIVSLLQKMGWEINEDNVLKGSDVPTKAHIGRAVLENPLNKEKLVQDFGSMPTEGAFIEETMIIGKDAFVKSADDLRPEIAIEAIHNAGGVAILAHPSFYVIKGESLEKLCEKFMSLGIDGFEAINIQYDKSNNDTEVQYVEQFTEIAHKNNLCISGGSDYHDDNEERMGKFIDLAFKNYPLDVPYSILEDIKRRHLSRIKKS